MAGEVERWGFDLDTEQAQQALNAFAGRMTGAFAASTLAVQALDKVIAGVVGTMKQGWSDALKWEVTTKRLAAMEETRDGFRLAEIDLELRGPGEFFGTRQSGTPDLKVAQLTDTRLLHAAQLEAKAILRDDPGLNHIEHALLRSQVEAFWAKAVEAN